MNPKDTMRDRAKPQHSVPLAAGPSADAPSSDCKTSLGITFHSKKPVFRFVVLLLLLLGLFELAAASSYARNHFIPASQALCARLSGSIMRTIGEDAIVIDATISSPRFSVNIKRGCDAIQPASLFVAAVIAAPVLIKHKALGIVGGLIFLMVLNLARIVSLFYVGIHFSQDIFEFMHHDVWQVTFILLAILAWASWAIWAARLSIRSHHEHG